MLIILLVNGNREWLSCHNNTRDEVIKWLDLLRTQNGNSSDIRLRKMWHTDMPSIQGPWTPFMLRNPNCHLIDYPNLESSYPIDVDRSSSDILIKMFEKQQQQQQASD